jgi:hypothetical protein
MAKSGYEDFGDFEWDDFGDDGFGDFSAEPPKDDRNPATKLVGAFAEGVKDNLLNPSTQARFMRDVLPEGYVTALDTIDGITTGTKEILNEAKNAAKPIIKDLKRGTRLILPKVQAVLPDGIVKRLEEFGKDYDEKKNVKSLTPDEVEANATNVELGTIFNAHFEAQQKRDTQKDSEQQLKDIAFLKQGSNSLIIQYQLNENMKRLVEYNDQITAQYQRKSLEIQFKHYFVSRRLLNTMEKHLALTEPAYKTLIKNTGMPDIIKYKDHEKMVDQLKSQIFGRVTEPLSQWYRGVGQRIVKKAKGEITTFFSNVGSHINDAVMNGEQVQSDLADQLETVRDLGGDQAVDDLRIDLAGGAAGQFASDWVLKKFIDPIKKKLKENGTIGINELKLLRKFDRLPMQMRDFANSSTDEFNWLGAGKDLIKGAMGKNEIQTTIQKSGVDELEQQAYMTRKTIRTWEEVIPGWLSKIHQQVKVIATNDPNAEQEHYSFETASFQTSSQLKATLTERVAGKSKKNTLEYYTARVMKVIDPDGTKLSPDATKALRKYIIGLAWDGGKDFDPAKLMNEHNFPTTIPIAVKGEIVKHMRDRFDFDDTVELDENNNFKGEPYKEEKETWEKLRSLSMGYASLAMNVPDAMKDALAAARQGQVGLLQEAGLATMDSGGTYKLNRDKVLELLTAPELPPAAPPAPPSGAPAGPGLKDGGLFDGGSPLIHRVTGDVVDAPGSGANDTANAQLANREFVMNARSTNLPGMLPLLRYLNNLGNNDETLSQSIAAEDGVGTGSHVENAIHRFHDDFKTFGGDILQVSKEALSKMDKLTGFNIGLGNMEMPDLTEMRDKIKAFGSDIHDQAANYAEFTKQRGIKLKDKALGSLNISDELKQKLANLELSAMFEDGIPDIKELEKKLKDLVSKEELAAITAEYKKYHKRIEELRKQGMDLGERTAQRAARGATRAVGAVPKIISWLRQKGKQQTDAGIARVKGIAGWGGDKVGLGYQKLKDMVSDVWVPGETRPRLTAAAIRAGAYIDVNTNKTIEVFDDITGEVRDKAGNIVISFEDYQKGLFNPNGKTILGFLTKKANQLKDLAMSPVKAMRARVGNLKNTLIDLFDGPEDVYVKGEMDKPRLYKRLMEMGVYRVKETGVIVKRISDIKGVIEQVDGDKIEVVLTLDDFKKGIVNAKGEPFKTVSSFLSNLAKVALAKGFEAGKKVLDVAKNGMNFLTDILKSGGKRLGKFTGSFSDMINISMFASTKDVVNRLETIIEMLKSKGFKANEKPEEAKAGDSANPEQSSDGLNPDSPTEEARPKGFLERMSDKAKAVKDRIGKRFKRGGDADGDGDRDNSAADRAQRREEEGRRNEEKSRWAKLLAGLKDKGSGAMEKTAGLFGGLLSKFAPVLMGAVTLVSTVATSTAKVLGFLGKAGMFLGKGALGLAKGVGSLAWGATKLVGRAAWWGATKALPMVARGAVGLIASPIGVAITAAYVGYKLYQYATREEAPLTKFRMAQYGFKHDDKDNVAKIITLEQECLKIVKVVPDQPAKLGSGKTLGELTQIFGVSMENQEDLEKWIMWFQHRFKPIFLMTVTELFKHTGKTNLTDIDKVLLTKQKLELIRTVNTLKVETNPYKVTTSPFAGQESVPLSMDDVKDAYDDAIDYIEDNADKNDQTATASSGVKPKPEGKGWWETAKDSLGALGAGTMTMLNKAGQKVASVASAIGGGLATAGKATVNALGNGAKAVGGALAAGGGAIAAGAGKLYTGAVAGASSMIEGAAEVFKVKPVQTKNERHNKMRAVIEAARKAGDPHPEIVGAQWALESDWGRKESGKFNFFGIKARKGEPGTTVATHEVLNGKRVAMPDKFKDYKSLEDGIAGRVNFMLENPRYRKAGYFDAQTPYEAANALLRGVYATDPHYPAGLMKILAGVGIDGYKVQDKSKATPTAPTISPPTGDIPPMPLKPRKTDETTVPSYGPALNIPLNKVAQQTAQATAQTPFMLQPVAKPTGAVAQGLSGTGQAQTKMDIDQNFVDMGKRSFRAGAGVDMKMDPSFANKVYGLFGEYFKRTGKVVAVNSCFRDPKKQLALYNAFISRSKRPPLVAKPGKSKHEHGLAIDISSEQANEMDKLGLLKKYGIIRPLLKHPKYPEPWHLENDSNSPTTVENSDTVNYINPLVSPLGVTEPETTRINSPLKLQPTAVSTAPAVTNEAQTVPQPIQPTVSKTTAAIETKRETESKSAMESMDGLSAIAKEQLRHAMRSADTLDNIFTLMQRMEKQATSKPANPAQPLPNPQAKPTPKSPIDVSRTY